jgi:hypothetical protein
MVTHDPLHGSGRAVLPRPALASGDDAEAPQRIGMIDTQRRQPAVDEPPHSAQFTRPSGCAATAHGARASPPAFVRLKPGSRYQGRARASQNGRLPPRGTWGRPARSALGRLHQRFLEPARPRRRPRETRLPRNPSQAPACRDGQHRAGAPRGADVADPCFAR